MEGQGRSSISSPWPSETGSPDFSSTTSAFTPGNGVVADPGFVAVIPGSGVIMIAPVSVCHQVSTIGQRPPPITTWYQSQAFGLIGSPTEPRRGGVGRSYPAGVAAPRLMEGG